MEHRCSMQHLHQSTMQLRPAGRGIAWEPPFICCSPVELVTPSRSGGKLLIVFANEACLYQSRRHLHRGPEGCVQPFKLQAMAL